MNETVTIPSEAARNADASVSRLRWSRPSVIDVLCVAGYGITRFGWGMQTHRPAVPSYSLTRPARPVRAQQGRDGDRAG